MTAAVDGKAVGGSYRGVSVTDRPLINAGRIQSGSGQGPDGRALTRTLVVGTAGLEPATSASRTLPGHIATDVDGQNPRSRLGARRQWMPAVGGGRGMNAG